MLETLQEILQRELQGGGQQLSGSGEREGFDVEFGGYMGDVQQLENEG